jgi:hypothetical protein
MGVFQATSVPVVAAVLLAGSGGVMSVGLSSSLVEDRSGGRIRTKVRI